MQLDLHMHSWYSDGTYSPHTLVCLAKKANMGIVALTDHDTMDGIPEFLACAKEEGFAALAGVELDTESPFELHILGLGLNPVHPKLIEALCALKRRRCERNAAILKELSQAGLDISNCNAKTGGVQTRLHIAIALVENGYAKGVSDAFRAYLAPGRIGYRPMRRLPPAQAIALIHEAGGIAVLAHPCHIKSNPHAVVRDLSAVGLDGIEAYYPSSTQGETALFENLAAQHHLLLTAGSDFHGDNRPHIQIGCACEENPALEKTARFLAERYLSGEPYS